MGFRWLNNSELCPDFLLLPWVGPWWMRLGEYLWSAGEEMFWILGCYGDRGANIVNGRWSESSKLGSCVLFRFIPTLSSPPDHSWVKILQSCKRERHKIKWESVERYQEFSSEKCSEGSGLLSSINHNNTDAHAGYKYNVHWEAQEATVIWGESVSWKTRSSGQTLRGGSEAFREFYNKHQ